MSIDAKFLAWIERNFPGRDIPAHNDQNVHNHGSSTIRHGRGTVLTVDLTNRCNMMCDPCFMDANQVGYVHELTWEDIKEILDNAVKVKPRRQMSVQFSGGEPTVSPYFIDAIRNAREVETDFQGALFKRLPKIHSSPFGAAQGLRHLNRCGFLGGLTKNTRMLSFRVVRQPFG